MLATLSSLMGGGAPSLASLERDVRSDVKITAGGVSYVSSPLAPKRTLYVARGSFVFTGRMLELGVVILIAQLTNNSLFFVALAFLLSCVARLFAAGSVHEWLDRVDRLEGVRLAIRLAVCSVSLTYFFSAFLASWTRTEGVAWSVWLLPPIFAVASLAVEAVVRAVDQDWLPVLSDRDDAWLATTKASLVTIDTTCAITAPIATGLCFYYLSHPLAALLLLCLHVASALFMYAFLQRTYAAWAALASRSLLVSAVVTSTTRKALDEGTGGSSGSGSGSSAGGYVLPSSPTAREREASERLTKERKMQDLIESLGRTDDEAERGEGAAGETIVAPLHASVSSLCGRLCKPLWELAPSAWRDAGEEAHFNLGVWARSGVAAPMLSLSLLALSTITSGPLPLVYLRSTGVTDYWLGVLRGCAFASLHIGVRLSSRAVARWGLWSAGQKSLHSQLVLACAAAISFFFLGSADGAVLVTIAVLLTGFALGCLEPVVRQIVNDGLPEAQRDQVTGTWAAVSTSLEAACLASALLLASPAHFYVLAVLSAAAIGASTALFHAADPTNQQQWAGLGLGFALVSLSSSHGRGTDKEEKDEDEGGDEGEGEGEDGSEGWVETVTFSPVARKGAGQEVAASKKGRLDLSDRSPSPGGLGKGPTAERKRGKGER